MVRSNSKCEIGFLSNEKRMNVAVTRAKRMCVLIGDSGTVGKASTFLQSLCMHFREHGQVRSAFDYQGHPDNIRMNYGIKTGPPPKQVVSKEMKKLTAEKH